MFLQSLVFVSTLHCGFWAGLKHKWGLIRDILDSFSKPKHQRIFFFLFGSFLVFLLLFFLLRYLLWLSKLSLVRFSWVVVLPFHRSTLLFCFAVICYSLVCLVAVHGSKWVAFSHTCCDHFVLQLVFLVTDGWMDNKVSMVDISYLMI